MELPVPTNVPPQLPLYQFHVAAVPRLPPFTVNVALPPEHTLVVEVVMDVAADEGAFILIVILEQAVELQVPSALT